MNSTDQQPAAVPVLEPDLLKRAEMVAAGLEACRQEGLRATFRAEDVEQVCRDLIALVAEVRHWRREAKRAEAARLQCAGDLHEYEALVGAVRQELGDGAELPAVLREAVRG